MDAFEWSTWLSRAYHEAGHVIAAHFYSLPIHSSTIRDDKGLGATNVDTRDNLQAAAVVAYAGLASQLLFDDSHNHNDDFWNVDRIGRSREDEEMAQEAIKGLLEEDDFATWLAESIRLREVARELVASERAKPLIVRVADALNEHITLDEDELRQLLR